LSQAQPNPWKRINKGRDKKGGNLDPSQKELKGTPGYGGLSRRLPTRHKKGAVCCRKATEGRENGLGMGKKLSMYKGKLVFEGGQEMLTIQTVNRI